MFFYLSKILWFLVDPGNLLLLALVVGSILTFTNGTKGRGVLLLRMTTLFALIVAVFPIGRPMTLALENRFPVMRELPAQVDGIIVLGGVVDEVVSRSRGQISIGGGIERLFALADLSKKYPDAKRVFTSGSGKLLTQNIKEADVVGPLLTALGLDVDRVLFEGASRNTYKNAVLTHEMVAPGPAETWILITSAFHMPRAIGVFRQAGWPIVAYPVHYKYRGDEGFQLKFNLRGGLNELSAAIHEWLGLVFYRLTGKTGSLFPAPS